MSFFQIHSTGKPAQKMYYAGSVHDVIEGKILPELKTKRFEAKDFAYGFQIASVGSTYENMGEAVIADGVCYSALPHKEGSSKVFSSSPHFFSSAIFLIPKGSYATHEVSCRDLCLVDAYRKIYEEIEAPFAVIAKGLLSKTSMTAIQKSPIHGENVFEHKDIYYPSFQDKEHVPVFFVGVITHQAPFFHDKLSLETVLYENPFEKQKGIVSHTHGLELLQKPLDNQKIEPSNVKAVWHLFEDKTHVEEMAFHIYKIKSMDNYLLKDHFRKAGSE